MKKALKIIIAIALISVIACALAACVPNNVDKAQSKLEKAGYKVTAIGDKDKDEGVVGGLVAYSGGLIPVPVLTATLYSSASEAKDAYNKLVDDKKNSEVKQKGKWVYFGESDAVKAFEK